MTATTDFVIRHGLPLVFVAVLVEQFGVPIPALPFLLAAGALSAVGKFNLLTGILATAMACLIADTSWFYLGKYRGNRVLGFLCRISLEPDSCVRRTQNVFTIWTARHSGGEVSSRHEHRGSASGWNVQGADRAIFAGRWNRFARLCHRVFRSGICF
jgi:hypothetical protein